MFAKLFVLVALFIAAVSALKCGTVSKEVIAFAQSKNLSDKVTAVLSAVCKETNNNDGQCDKKIQNLANILAGFAKIAAKCDTESAKLVESLSDYVSCIKVFRNLFCYFI